MTINLKVLDLSHHNTGPHGGPIDFAAIAAYGIRGVILKATQGLAYVDPTLHARLSAVRAAGLDVGAYHFADASDPLQQAKHFRDTVRPDDRTLMALDYEPNSDNTMSLNGARSFLRAMEDAMGRKAVLYSGNLIKEILGNKPDSYLGQHQLWLAHYNDTPKWPPAWIKPWLHQFSGDGTNNHGIVIPGVDPAQASKLDMNSFDGSDEDLAAQWAKPVAVSQAAAQPTPTPPAPPAQPVPPVSNERIGTVTANSLNVRSAFSSASQIIAHLPKNAKVIIEQETQNGPTKWYRIKAPAGWVSARYIAG